MANYERVQMDANGEYVDPDTNVRSASLQPGEYEEITFLDVNAHNKANRMSLADALSPADAAARNRESEANEALNQLKYFATLAEEAKAKANDAYEKGQHGIAQREADRYARLAQHASRLESQMIDRARFYSVHDAATPAPEDDSEAKLQAELAKIEQALGYKL